MKSNELLHEIFDKQDVKRIAPELGLHPSTLYKWCEPDGGKTSGALNPLERMAALIRAANDLRPLHWLCELFDGYFVRNRKGPKHAPEDLLPEENHVIREFGELMLLMSKAVEDGNITVGEARAIRSEWERLKSVTEGFVAGCEAGDFQTLRKVVAQNLRPVAALSAVHSSRSKIPTASRAAAPAPA